MLKFINTIYTSKESANKLFGLEFYLYFYIKTLVSKCITKIYFNILIKNKTCNYYYRDSR